MLLATPTVLLLIVYNSLLYTNATVVGPINFERCEYLEKLKFQINKLCHNTSSIRMCYRSFLDPVAGFRNQTFKVSRRFQIEQKGAASLKCGDDTEASQDSWAGNVGHVLEVNVSDFGVNFAREFETAQSAAPFLDDYFDIWALFIDINIPNYNSGQFWIMCNEKTSHIEEPLILRTMTFNTWFGGNWVENGLDKMAKHIREVDADIVFLQEMDPEGFQELLKKLGTPWTGVSNSSYNEWCCHILTKHKIILDTKFHTDSFTCAMTILYSRGFLINVVNVHLNFLYYGPDIVQNANNNTTVDQILLGDFGDKGRMQSILELNSLDGFQKMLTNSSAGIPLILAGDLNEPSHLDWTEKTKDLHKGWIVEWPVTKFLMDKLELIDSFRQLHYDPIVERGITWPTNKTNDNKKHEPNDRIDFIFYKSNLIRPIQSFIYAGIVNRTTAEAADWPSDHFAVVTEFEMQI